MGGRAKARGAADAAFLAGFSLAAYTAVAAGKTWFFRGEHAGDADLGAFIMQWQVVFFAQVFAQLGNHVVAAAAGEVCHADARSIYTSAGTTAGNDGNASLVALCNKVSFGAHGVNGVYHHIGRGFKQPLRVGYGLE